MKKLRLTDAALCLVLSGIFLTGCIRLWGGATYVSEKPGERVEKSYVLDTAELLPGSPAK